MDGEKCRQSGCNGTIEGGFCNACGLEPVGAPAAVAAAPTASARSEVASSLSGRTGSGSSRRGSSSTRKNLGLGLVAVPPLPLADPVQSIMAEPKVPEHKRFCSNPDCHDAAGNPTALKREAGFCPLCGKRYSFVPSLRPGDLVGDQYEVKGCMAYGGLGWIYLANDNTLGRWVVLKGLLNTEDEAAAAAAVAERQFLAAVKHPNIVGIYNFVKRGTEGFIVMEYVNGTTVKDLRKARGPLPPAEAIAYVHRILGAFAYLHRQGMVFCDFKPDNFMLEGDPPDVKLIDMGAVRLIDDPRADIYGTRGYSAPEAGQGPTAVSDLFTVGRSLAVLMMDFRFQSAYEFTLPPPTEQPVLAAHDSLHRLLLRATARDPDARFQSADEMADQLAGVLREVVAGTAPMPPVESALFGGDVLGLRDGESDGIEGVGPDLLPDLKGDATDPAAGFLLSIASLTNPKRQLTMLQGALPKFPDSVELRLQLAKNLIALDSFDQAEAALAEIESRQPLDWRIPWYRGLAFLARGKAGEAQIVFDRVYSELPGELAAKLALAIAAELTGEGASAVKFYDVVSRTDSSFSTAAFGLARCLARAGKRAEAAEAYGRVPATSSLHHRAQMALARILIRAEPAPPGPAELQQASRIIEELVLEGKEQANLRVEVLESALSLLGSQKLRPDPSIRLLGQPLEEIAVRRGLEDALRQAARWENDRARQIELVDRANALRPVTWL